MAVAAAAILGLAATSVKSAEAASVKLTFFENADTPAVGVGSFNYDESTPYEAIFESSFFGTLLEIKASDKVFVVQDFAVNLLGQSWNLSQATVEGRALKLSPLLWIPFERNPLVVGEYDFFGSPEPYLWGNWEFGALGTTPSLIIFGYSDGPGSRMSWRQNASRSDGSFGFNEGYVIAEPVPEPATTAGLAMAAAGLGYAKKKFGASKV
jgi:hypothetical protein